MSGACVRIFLRFLNLRLQIAVEWLHECCHVVLPCESRDAGLRRGVAKRIVMAASKFLGVSRLRGRVGSTIAFCS